MLRIFLANVAKNVNSTRSISNVPVAFRRDIDVVKLPENLEAENQLAKRIKYTNDSGELLSMMSTMKKSDIEPHQLAMALTQLFELQKNPSKRQLIKNHPGLNNIFHLLKFKAPRMDSNDLVSSLKVLSSIGLKSDDFTVQQFLHIIKDRINDFSLNNLLFLSFILNKMQRTPLIEALQIAIPVVFDLNASLKLDHENTKELTDLLHFISQTSMRVSSKSMTNIMTALILHGDNLELQNAKSIVWSLTKLETFDQQAEKLLSNCMSVLNNKLHQLKFEEIETTLDKLSKKGLSLESVFYNEQFLKNCVKYVIEKDLGFLSASYLQKKLNKIHFVSIDLLDYLDQTIVRNHSEVSSTTMAGLLTLADGFSTANYKSENWEIIKSLILENPLMQSDRMDLPWLRLALNLVSLDVHFDILTGKIFSSKFLEKYFNKEMEFYDYSQLLLLWQAVTILRPEYNGPQLEQTIINDAIIGNVLKPNETYLKELADTFGGRQLIQTNVLSSHGHCLEFVISFDNQDQPIAMPCPIKRYDELPKSQVKSVAVFFCARSLYSLNYPQRFRGIFDLRKRTIEALGIRAVYVSTQLWNQTPEGERQSYLEREIRYALNEL